MYKPPLDITTPKRRWNFKNTAPTSGVRDLCADLVNSISLYISLYLSPSLSLSLSLSLSIYIYIYICIHTYTYTYTYIYIYIC